MVSCPICHAEMKRERRELKKGIYAWVEACPKCEEEVIDEEGYKELYEQVYKRKLFKIGGSLGVRIPKRITDIVGLDEDSSVTFDVKDDKIILEKTA
jgi:protein PhnA/antitoxin MazE